MGQLAPPIASRWIQNYWHCTSSVAPCSYHRADNFFTPLHLGSLITSGPAASRLDSTSSRLWLCFIYSLSGSIFPDLSLVSVFQSSKSCGRRFYRYIPFHYLGLATNRVGLSWRARGRKNIHLAPIHRRFGPVLYCQSAETREYNTATGVIPLREAVRF